MDRFREICDIVQNTMIQYKIDSNNYSLDDCKKVLSGSLELKVKLNKLFKDTTSIKQSNLDSINNNLCEDIVQIYLDENNIEIIDDIFAMDNNVAKDSNSVKMYLKDISKYPTLTLDQERILFTRYEKSNRQDKDIKNQIINYNLKLVVSIAKRFAKGEENFLDYIQEGNIGLMKAVDKYEVSRGFKFSTYATWWIKQTIIRSQSDKDHIIRIPVHVNEIIINMHKNEKELEYKLGRYPTNSELGKAMNLSEKQIENLKLISAGPVSIDMPVDTDEDTDLGSFVADDNQIGPEEEVISGIVTNDVRNLIMGLSYREQQIVILRFGLCGYPPHTLAEVAKIYHLTRERIRQIEAKALKKLSVKAKKLYKEDEVINGR